MNIPINPSSKVDITKTTPLNTIKNSTATSVKEATEQTESNAEQQLEPAVLLDIGSGKEAKATYTKPVGTKPDLAKIEELQKRADEALRPLRQMVEALLKKQGKAFHDAGKVESKDSKEDMVTITPEIRAEAQKQIGDGGEYSVENVSTRLVDYAKALSGGDKSKYDELKDSIDKGFAEAKKAFGGSLPEISQQTYDMTMKKLEEWAQSSE